MESILKFKKGDILIKEGDESKDMYFLRSGLLKAYKQIPDSEETATLKLIKANEIFGEMSFIDDKPRSASVVALADSEVSRLDYSYFRKLLDEQPSWIKLVLTSLSTRVRYLNERDL